MKHRLLLVEDNEMNLAVLQDWLESEDFEVQTAKTIADAQDSIRRTRPSLVLLDVRLGAEDGLDLVKWMRAEQDCSQIPVLAVTAHAMRHEKERILQQGCNG